MANLAMLDVIDYVHMHAWSPIGPMQGTNQLIPPAVPQGVMHMCQQLCPGHEGWDIRPMLGRGGCG